MSARLPGHALDKVALKWRALAEQRRAHFIDLYDSGRWKHYYEEQHFLICMREAIRQSERWAEIAPRPEDAVFAEPAHFAADVPQRAAG
jgi:uncharacterized repeat protein (TIGR03809 family)